MAFTLLAISAFLLLFSGGVISEFQPDQGNDPTARVWSHTDQIDVIISVEEPASDVVVVRHPVFVSLIEGDARFVEISTESFLTVLADPSSFTLDVDQEVLVVLDIMVPFHVRGSFPIDIVVSSENYEIEGSTTITVSASEGSPGINVEAMPLDHDEGGFIDDVQITVTDNSSGNEIEGSEIYIDDVYMGTTNETGVLISVNNTKGDHYVRAEYNAFNDTTDFFIEDPELYWLGIYSTLEDHDDNGLNDATILLKAGSDFDFLDLLMGNGTRIGFDTSGSGSEYEVEIYDLPAGIHTLEFTIEIDDVEVVNTTRIGSFGPYYPDLVTASVQAVRMDTPFLDDARVYVEHDSDPMDNITVRIGSYSDETSPSGYATIEDISEGTSDIHLLINGVSIPYDLEFDSEGIGSYVMTVTATPTDTDGDGYLDDFDLEVHDHVEDLEDARIYLDTVLKGVTNSNGRFTVENVGTGDRTITVEIDFDKVYSATKTVTSDGIPDIVIDPSFTADRIVFQQGEDLDILIQVERASSLRELASKGNLTVHMNGDEVYNKQLDPVLNIGDLSTLIDLDLDTSSWDTGHGIIDYQIITNVKKWLGRIEFDLYSSYVELEVEPLFVSKFEGSDLPFRVDVINPNDEPAVVLYPSEILTYKITRSGNVFYTSESGDIDLSDPYVVVPGGETRSYYFNHTQEQEYLPFDDYTMVVTLKGLAQDNATFLVKQSNPGSSKFIGIPWNTTTISIIVSASVLGGLLGASRVEIAKLSMLAIVLPLYARIKKEKVLDHFMRGQIYEYIRLNPGTNYSELLDHFKLNNGTLTYHLSVLEREEFLKSVRDGVYRRYYLTGTKVNPNVLSNVRAKIISVISLNPGISQSKIATSIGESRRLVNYHIKVLAKDDVVELVKQGRSSQCYLNRRNLEFN